MASAGGNDVLKKTIATYKQAIARANMRGALNMYNKIVDLCILKSDDATIIKIAHDCFVYLSPEMRYENLINTYEGRRLSDVALYFLLEQIRKRRYIQSFAPSRTLLTPHRRRQLAKTMKPEPRVFAFGSNTKHCLGIDTESGWYINTPNELIIPPVYKMKMSSTHSVFWCHDGNFYGCGEAKNFMIGPTLSETIRQPMPLDLQFRLDEYSCGFKVLEHGTLIESNIQMYFIGDFEKSKEYIATIHDGEFKQLYNHNNRLFVCDTFPELPITNDKLDDPKNVVEIKILGQAYVIKVYPGYWTELNPNHEKRRPVCFLLDGQEVTDIRIENIASSTIWVVHEFALYFGKMHMMWKEENDDDERNLDNYVLLIELQEYHTPTPFVATGVVTNNTDSVLMKCGDYPCLSIDHLDMAERRNRGKVHRMMFETVEKYMQDGANYEQYLVCKRRPLKEHNVDYLIAEAEAALETGQLSKPLEMDWMGRLEDHCRYANFFSFLCYAARPRIGTRIPKCFDMDIDTMTESRSFEKIARFRMKALFEEFERVNYPGTSVWKPTEFLVSYAEPEDDESTEGQYGAAAVRWSVQEFIEELRKYKNHANYCETDAVNWYIMDYLINTIWYAQDMYTVIRHELGFATDNPLVLFLQYVNQETLDGAELVFPSLDPRKVFETRMETNPNTVLDDPLNIVMHYTLRYRDLNLDDAYYRLTTSATFLRAQNPILLQYVDEGGNLNLNDVYPDDERLQRLIVQTHFIGHGVTDLDGCEEYYETFTALGYQLVHTQKYMHRDGYRYRGYLLPLPNFPTIPLVSMTPTATTNYQIASSEGSVVFINSDLRKIYSSHDFHHPLPNTLPAYLLYNAIRGLYDRRAVENLPIIERLALVDWYFEAKMLQAQLDMMKQITMDVTTRDVAHIRRLVECYPVYMHRIIAQHRPAMLLWPRVPLPNPMCQHVKIIIEMWPKNEFERRPRLPKITVVNKNGTKEKTVFRQVSNREWRKHYTCVEEHQTPRFSALFSSDFPLPYNYRPYRPANGTIAHPTVTSAGPQPPERRRLPPVAPTIVTAAAPPPTAPTTTAPAQPAPKPAPAPEQTVEDKMRIIMERFSEKRGRNGRRGRRK
ncbi:hypothetical protein B9Z55_017143 [Caenorhabditis nigoni]|uniref:Uncharacterized protein n=1 Tax=Caenorhabditis nigoni TaxID=1611254 RepID=A0A2G5T8L1_9PELO|nr:hypothetical protein B9Z55_017143 [Caenorhabditis nigoni]